MSALWESPALSTEPFGAPYHRDADTPSSMDAVDPSRNDALGRADCCWHNSCEEHTGQLLQSELTFLTFAQVVNGSCWLGASVVLWGSGLRASGPRAVGLLQSPPTPHSLSLLHLRMLECAESVFVFFLMFYLLFERGRETA